MKIPCNHPIDRTNDCGISAEFFYCIGIVPGYELPGGPLIARCVYHYIPEESGEISKNEFIVAQIMKV